MLVIRASDSDTSARGAFFMSKRLKNLAIKVKEKACGQVLSR
jgi:hypothetical protein